MIAVCRLVFAPVLVPPGESTAQRGVGSPRSGHLRTGRTIPPCPPGPGAAGAGPDAVIGSHLHCLTRTKKKILTTVLFVSALKDMNIDVIVASLFVKDFCMSRLCFCRGMR